MIKKVESISDLSPSGGQDATTTNVVINNTTSVSSIVNVRDMLLLL